MTGAFLDTCCFTLVDSYGHVPLWTVKLLYNQFMGWAYGSNYYPVTNKSIVVASADGALALALTPAAVTFFASDCNDKYHGTETLCLTLLQWWVVVASRTVAWFGCRGVVKVSDIMRQPL